ncbi:MAG: recombinase family protein [Bacteroidota bacterium]
MKLGYARVSTYEQNLDLQLDALKKEGCKHLFSDKVSGVKAKKPNFDKLLSYAREGDTIVVWKLDRLGRSTVQLIELAESLQQRGVHLKSLSESIDTTSAMGKMFFQLMCILAEHERNIIRERTQAGLASARARGRTGGRPKGLSQRYQNIAEEVGRVYQQGHLSTEQIREMFGIKSQPTLYKILDFAGVEHDTFVKPKKR